MTSAEEQLAKFRDLYEKGLLDEATYKTALKGLGIDIKDSNIGIVGDHATVQGDIQHGDRIDIDGGSDVVVAKDQGRAVINKTVIMQSPGPDPAETRRTYLSALIKSLKHLPLRGLDTETGDPAGNKDRLELDRVYVALDTKTSVKLTKAEKKAQEESDPFGSRDTRPLSALEAATANRCLVILGDPGSGKSTFMNHLTYCLALKGLSPSTCDRLSCWPEDEADIIPIPVVLRDFAGFIPEEGKQAEEHHLWDFIESRLKSQRLDAAVSLLEKSLDDGKAVVLLDGLDEIPTVEKRRFIRDAVARFAARYARSRFIVTCRVLSYQDEKWQLDRDDFPVAELAPFDEEKIDAFITAWYEDLRRLHVVKTPEESEELVRRLKIAVRRPDLWRLAPNPLLLTVMALVHTHKGRLPDARALLYEETVDILLWRWEQVKISGQKSLPRLQELLLEINLADVDLKKLLWKLAFEAHKENGHAEEKTLADIKEWDLIRALSGLHPENSMDWANQIIETIKMRAGLLLEREPGVYSFPHRTFQEYLAGAHLSSLSDFAKTASALTESGNFWREVVLLAVGRQVYHSGDYEKPLALAAELCPSEISDDEVSWRKVRLAGEVLVEIGMNRVNQSNLGKDIAKRLRVRLTELLRKGRLSPKERGAAGNALSRIGDPRFDPENWYLPADEDMGFVTVPVSGFLMGSDKEKDSEADDDELPQHTVKLSEYQIAKYPVTVAQYKVFAKETSLDLDEKWKKYNTFDNHPVVYVNWHNAAAYCEWLTEKLKDRGTVSLPTEAQWEKAARGDDQRIYPWGNTFDPTRCNSNVLGLGDTTPAGIFPEGASPYGVLDMAGNVLEWTCSLWGKSLIKPDFKYPYVSDDGREDMSSGSDRVVRGGSWFYLAGDCRAASRFRPAPDYRDYYLGFRLVLLPGQQDAECVGD